MKLAFIQTNKYGGPWQSATHQNKLPRGTNTPAALSPFITGFANKRRIQL